MFEYIRDFVLEIRCPNYMKNMPKEKKDGKYVAVALRTTPWTSKEIYTEEHSNNIDAYIASRKLALKLESETDTYNGEDLYGIEWAVRKEA